LRLNVLRRDAIHRVFHLLSRTIPRHESAIQPRCGPWLPREKLYLVFLSLDAKRCFSTFLFKEKLQKKVALKNNC
jgi:hypothetical protein